MASCLPSEYTSQQNERSANRANAVTDGIQPHGESRRRRREGPAGAFPSDGRARTPRLPRPRRCPATQGRPGVRPDRGAKACTIANAARQEEATKTSRAARAGSIRKRQKSAARKRTPFVHVSRSLQTGPALCSTILKGPEQSALRAVRDLPTWQAHHHINVQAGPSTAAYGLGSG